MWQTALALSLGVLIGLGLTPLARWLLTEPPKSGAKRWDSPVSESERYWVPHRVMVFVWTLAIFAAVAFLGLFVAASARSGDRLAAGGVFASLLGAPVICRLLVDLYLRNMWLSYYESQGVPHAEIPDHDTFPSWVGTVESLIAWTAVFVGQLGLLLAWLTFRAAVNLTRERADAVSGKDLRNPFVWVARAQGRALPRVDPRVSQLSKRTPVNIFVFGVGLNLLLASTLGAVGRYCLWEAVCGDRAAADPVVEVRELGLPLSAWTCGATVPHE